MIPNDAGCDCTRPWPAATKSSCGSWILILGDSPPAGLHHDSATVWSLLDPPPSPPPFPVPPPEIIQKFKKKTRLAIWQINRCNSPILFNSRGVYCHFWSFGPGKLVLRWRTMLYARHVVIIISILLALDPRTINTSSLCDLIEGKITKEIT